MSQTIMQKMGNGDSSTQQAGPKAHTRHPTMDKRTKSMAKREEPGVTLWNDKTCAQKAWTLHNRRGMIPSCLQAAPTSTVEHTPRFPRLPPYALHRDRGARRELLKAPT